MTPRQLQNLKRLRTLVRIIAILAGVITVAWLVVAVLAAMGRIDTSPVTPALLAFGSATIVAMSAHVGWVLASQKIAQVEARMTARTTPANGDPEGLAQ